MAERSGGNSNAGAVPEGVALPKGLSSDDAERVSENFKPIWETGADDDVPEAAAAKPAAEPAKAEPAKPAPEPAAAEAKPAPKAESPLRKQTMIGMGAVRIPQPDEIAKAAASSSAAAKPDAKPSAPAEVAAPQADAPLGKKTMLGMAAPQAPAPAVVGARQGGSARTSRAQDRGRGDARRPGRRGERRKRRARQPRPTPTRA